MIEYITSLFQGRLSRIQFLLTSIYFSLILAAIVLVVVAPAIVLGTYLEKYGTDSVLYQLVVVGAGLLLLGMFQLIAVIIETSTIVRRLHDLNQPWWLIIFAVVPIINFLAAVYLLVAPGTKGANDYGNRLKSNSFRTLLKLPKKK